jgi:uncharacterized protein YjiS (DUF1127 family)
MTPLPPRIPIGVIAKTVVDDVQRPKELLPEPPQEILDPLSGKVEPTVRNDMAAEFFQLAWQSKERAVFLLQQFDNKTLEDLTLIQQIATARAFMGLCTDGMKKLIHATSLAETKAGKRHPALQSAWLTCWGIVPGWTRTIPITK